MNNELIFLRSSENKIEAIRQCIQTICIFRFQDVTMRELDLLCELLRCGGVNDKSKKSFMISYKTSSANYGQLVKRLSDKGILVDLPHRNGKRLADIFEHFAEKYLESKNEEFIPIAWKVNL